MGCSHSSPQLIGDEADWDPQMANSRTKAASIVIGPLHSLPLNLKYQRLHLSSPYTLKFPWKETLSAVSDCSLLNEQSCKNEIKGNTLSQIMSPNGVNRQMALILVLKQYMGRDCFTDNRQRRVK